jgi:glycosyltransferase involved in cell wall biosynthesis
VSVTDRHKGIDLALDALRRIAASTGGISFACVSFGGGRLPKGLPFSVINLGGLSDQISLILAYSAADVFVCPSRQDNLPNTVLESLACGTPVVAFAVGGIPDMVEHGVNGYLAAPEDTHDLAVGIALLLGDADLRQRMGQAGREKVEREFSSSVVARRYMALYEHILGKRLEQARGN